MRFLALAVAVLCGASGMLRADFSYDQTSKVTGGAIAGAMKVAGVFSKSAREPIRSTMMVSGDRMATVNKDSISIIDLSSETFTEVDLQKKTYATITFADFKKAMEAMMKKVTDNKEPAGNLKFKIGVENTGVAKNVAGIDTKQAIMTLEMQGKDEKSGAQGGMVMMSEMYLAPKIAGYDEVMNFHKRMALKLNWTPSTVPMMRPDMSQGMAELQKEMAKLEGTPVLQVVRMGQSVESLKKAAAAPKQPEQDINVKGAAGEAATDAAVGSAANTAGNKLGKLGGLAGGLGGFGGFGKKKKKEEPEPEAQPQPTKEQQEAQAAQAGMLMEMTMEMSNFSSSVDASKFDVPAGFKKVQHAMAKQID